MTRIEKAWTNANEMTLEDLIIDCTAFGSLAEFETAAKSGYVPSVLVKTLKPRASGLSYQAKVNALAHKLALAGFRVWTGIN